jgi:hypothetical protein
MLHRTIPVTLEDTPVQAMSDQLRALINDVRTRSHQEAPTLQQLEEQVLRTLKDLGTCLLATLCQLIVPPEPPATYPCACGATARFQRIRPAPCRTLLGPITLQRPYYLCPACHQGVAPLDHHLGFCPGSRSAALDEVLALLGATQDSFADAATVLERLTLLQVAPNTVRAATEQLGARLAEVEQAQVTALQADQPPAVVSRTSSGPLCVSLDGVQAHLTPEGWKEVCGGAVYQVRPCRQQRERRADAVQAEAIRSIAELGSQREAFGWQLYAEAVRRGATTTELVVIGDGAHWLWELVALHFPQATQILDWFHVTEYVWNAATAIWGERHPDRTSWAEQQLGALWDGRVAAVLAELQRHTAAGDAVGVAQTYFTNQQARMHDPAYRARGLPIGSGTIESGCKQLVRARLKQAGMIWRAAGARQVVKVRAWLKRGRWAEALAQRPRRQRGYRRRQGVLDEPLAGQVVGVAPGRVRRAQSDPLPPAVVAAVRTELAAGRTTHPWKRAWSWRQQRQEVETSAVNPAVLSSA